MITARRLLPVHSARSTLLSSASRHAQQESATADAAKMAPSCSVTGMGDEQRIFWPFNDQEPPFGLKAKRL
jgi:hypothetical protein